MIIAYIDPGSGALLLQTALAGVVGAVVFFRQKIAGWFHPRKTAPGKPAAPVPAAGGSPKEPPPRG